MLDAPTTLSLLSPVDAGWRKKQGGTRGWDMFSCLEFASPVIPGSGRLISLSHLYHPNHSYHSPPASRLYTMLVEDCQQAIQDDLFFAIR